jgi:serine phosphatase RsbU (regulator of sigma subunit)
MRGHVDRSVPAAGLSKRNAIRITVAVIALLGLAVTAGASLTAWRVDRGNEHRLLRLQTRQAASLVGVAVTAIASPLQTALDIASATNGDPAQFARFIATYTGSGGLFVSASLWRTSGPTPVVLASAGVQPGLPTSSAAARAFITRSVHNASFVVTNIAAAGTQRVGYALANPKTPTYAVYAERAIPANRRVPVESTSAFADLNFATYLGSTTTAANLETTDVAPNRLPLRGDTYREEIPFGDTALTLVTSPIGHLGGSLEALLPWVFLATGVVLTAGAAVVAGALVNRRRAAEDDSLTIRGLYEQLDGLYAEQRTIAETLQHALLPQSNPRIPNLEVASRYVAGARGVDIGGDWYSLILLDDGHFGFVVGDVSGRGVDAAAVMARIRFTLRAYLFEGHSPDAVLEMCSRQLDVVTDGHFATVLVGLGDYRSRTVTFANAGHPNPLMVTQSRSTFIVTDVGLPLGVAPTEYNTTTIVMEPGSTLYAFTDGLVERREEDLDVGLGRLVEAAAWTDQPLEDQVTAVLTAMTSDGSEDDTAILAFRWGRDPD